MAKKTPVIIITGYLGAGKTTLLKNVLKKPKKKIAVLMNEFGEIGIDSEVVRGRNIDVKEVLGGCVCCSLTGELQAAIAEILEKIGPDVIVIETTGVAEPDAVVGNLGEIEGVFIGSVVTVVDADALVRFPKLGHVGRTQIESADVILLNKTDLVKPDKLRELYGGIRGLNPSAKVVQTTYSGIDMDAISGTERAPSGRAHGSHEPLFMESFVYRTEKIMNRPMFLGFVSKMPPEVYRAKGHVEFSDGSLLFNYVNGRHDFSEARGKRTELVFIGENLGRQKEKILGELKRCEM